MKNFWNVIIILATIAFGLIVTMNPDGFALIGNKIMSGSFILLIIVGFIVYEVLCARATIGDVADGFRIVDWIKNKFKKVK